MGVLDLWLWLYDLISVGVVLTMVIQRDLVRDLVGKFCSHIMAANG